MMQLTDSRRNYQKELDNILEGLEEAPALLLHCCCAPCSSYVLEYLSEHFRITVFFYNPNITEEEEYKKRKEELIRLISEMKVKYPISVAEAAYESEQYREKISGFENEKEGGKRCEICFRLRLQKTAEEAKKRKSDYFTTTLTISPLKNAHLLNALGEEIGKENGIRFLPSDFKKKGGYQRSIELSKAHRLYRQDYCGCEFSRRKEIFNEAGDC